MADDDPKHTSRHAQNYLEKKGINWSPNINPIENLWHELKEYIRREVKLKMKEELIDAIKAFWSTVDASCEKCKKYIRHLRK